MKFNSIIFHTTQLPELREFYEGKLKLQIGTYEKDGVVIPDMSDKYVNYHMNGVLFCFESDADRTDRGTVVITVQDLAKFRALIEKNGVHVVDGNDQWIKVKDPEDRALIFETAK